ncbi:hypothetical protein GCM10022226_54170 [Sphaerisporangium flaviroseum]|uniref:Nitrite/Sulfite reductase ferredoxin-like domain-containing protein n=1 Tax=Sphaerisporangium flaviroseum TaxID=509199 RepID=A0ABP7ITZ2_9ACTN
MAAAGLLPSATHERVRNILASPMAGLDGHGLIEVATLVRELDHALCARPALADLPGRFLFALDDGRGDMAILPTDVAFLPIPTPHGTTVEGVLLLAGEDCGLRVGLAEAVPAMMAAAEAFLDERAAQKSTAWRMAELYDGPSRVAARLIARGDARLIARGEVPASTEGTAQLHPCQAVHEATPVRPPAAAPPSPPGPGSTPTPSSTPAPRSTPTPSSTPAPRSTRTPPSLPPPAQPSRPPVPPVGFVAQSAERGALVVLTPLGRLTAGQAHALAAAAEAGRGELRLTPWRGAVVPGVARADAGRWLSRLSAAGLITDPASPWIGVTACTGRPGCAKSLSDVQSDAARSTTGTVLPGSRPDVERPDSTAHTVLSDSRPDVDRPGSVAQVGLPLVGGAAAGVLPVHWVGCERRCGKPSGPVVVVVATGDGYRVDTADESLHCASAEETAAVVAATRATLTPEDR